MPVKCCASCEYFKISNRLSEKIKFKDGVCLRYPMHVSVDMDYRCGEYKKRDKNA